MNKVKLSIAVLVFFLLMSCATHITLDQIQSIQKGMSLYEMRTLLEKTPKYYFNITNNKDYFCEIYPMQTGTRTVTSFTPATKYSPARTTTSQVPVTDDFIFIYQNEMLLYWGFLNEINKVDDLEIIAISQKILDKYEIVKHKRNY